jgi:hypothetical protein
MPLRWLFDLSHVCRVKIEDLLETEQLESRLLGQKDFMSAVQRFVDKEEKDAIQE